MSETSVSCQDLQWGRVQTNQGPSAPDLSNFAFHFPWSHHCHYALPRAHRSHPPPPRLWSQALYLGWKNLPSPFHLSKSCPPSKLPMQSHLLRVSSSAVISPCFDYVFYLSLALLFSISLFYPVSLWEYKHLQGKNCFIFLYQLLQNWAKSLYSYNI